VTETIAARGRILSLTRNFRSEPAVVEVVNEVCGAAMNGAAHELDGAMAATAISYEELQPQRSASEAAGLEWISLSEQAAADRRREEGLLVGTRIQELVANATVIDPDSEQVRPGRYADIAILYRARTNLELIEEGLRSTGIPYHIAGAQNLSERQEIVDLVNVMRLLDKPDDDLRAFGYLRSPFVALRDEVIAQHETDHINLLFNNAGIGGGGSFLIDSRDEWDKTFGVCWFGVYYCCRAFVPLLVASSEAHVINTSSVNGFWASLGPAIPHTAYSAAKFAVKGFTEALINDFRINAPHLKVSLVMPGHIGTSIVINSGRMLGADPKEMSDEGLEEARQNFVRRGFDLSNATTEQIRQALIMQGEMFRDAAPMSAAEAAKVILDGVHERRWRILVGEDAVGLDRLVRADPEGAYTAEFMERLVSETNWGLGDLGS